MNWNSDLSEYSSFLKIERSLSRNSVDAYLSDVKKLIGFLQMKNIILSPAQVTLSHLKDFIEWINHLGMTSRTQARVISGIKSFYKFLLLHDRISKDPTSLLEAPKIGRKLPEVLSVEEIDQLISAIDLSKSEGQRNKAMLEVMYSCGLRVSELIDLQISNLHFNMGFIKITGKGNKERLVPINNNAIKQIQYYLNDRNQLKNIEKTSENILFLNRRGKKLTRVMVFTIIKNLAAKINLSKKISPHTFRHSFASHLIDGGADLRAVQEMLGHESIITTEIYTHLDREYLRDTIIRFHPRS